MPGATQSTMRTTLMLSLGVAFLLLPRAMAQAQPARGEAINELRSLCESMAKDHISRSARQRAERFLDATVQRRWTDQTGSFSTLARYQGHDVDAAGEVVVALLKSNGVVARVPMGQLSAVDQKLMQELSQILTRLREDAVTYRDYLQEKLRARTVIDDEALRVSRPDPFDGAYGSNTYSTFSPGYSMYSATGSPYLSGATVGVVGRGTSISVGGYPYSYYSPYGVGYGIGYGVGYGYPSVYSAYPVYPSAAIYPYGYGGVNYGYRHRGHSHFGGHGGYGGHGAYGGHRGHRSSTPQIRPRSPQVRGGGAGTIGPRSPLTGGNAYGF